jgi:hypothetical protein
MTIKRSKNPRREGEEEAEENNDHDDDDSSESSIDSSTESSSPLETETDDDGYQIRQHALELLESLPERGSSNPQQQSGNNNIVNGIPRTTSSSIRPINASSSGYQSYQDSPNNVYHHTTSGLSYADFDATTTATTAPSSVGDYLNDERGGLSLAGVATMAFACVATCLTEGYRAASNYYGGHDEGNNSYPSVADLNTQNNYHHVARYRCESNNQTTASSNNSSHYNNGNNRDGYQARVGDREVMERGNYTQSVKNNEPTSRTSGETRTQQDEWEKVHVPSTYQRGGTG